MAVTVLTLLVACLGLVQGHVVEFDPDYDLLRLVAHGQGAPVAKPCDAPHCNLPTCRCSNDTIPGNWNNTQTPQMVVITVQNAVHDHNVNLYLDLFEGRVNKGNNCPARGSFYVSSMWSSPYAVQLLAHSNHEIGMNGAKDLGVPWWQNASTSEWAKQVEDNREILSRYSNIPRDQITGFRVPNLLMAGNTQLEAYKKAGVGYDATRVSLNRPTHTSLVWPYTYNYRSTQDCPIGVCADQAFPGLWQFPLQAIVGSNGQPCSAVRGCLPKTENETFTILKKAFDAKYNASRAPLMMSFDEEFFRYDFMYNGLSRFLNYVGNTQNAYIVSAAQALEWEANPTGRPCGPTPPPCRPNNIPLCSNPRPCYYDRNYKFVATGSAGIVYVTDMCVSHCPACYPRYGDPKGTSC